MSRHRQPEATSFRKDTAFLATLENSVLRGLFADRSRSSVRVWVPNTGSGEDAYWIAMLLADYVQTNELACDVRVFGSDSDQGALGYARAGLFPRAMENALPSEQLRRYFHAQASGYQAVKRIRDCVLFSPHNIEEDPPFSKIDLVVAERVFATVEPEAAAGVIQMLHYALYPGGHLLLGHREVPRGMSQFFTPIADDVGIFRCRDEVRPRLQGELLRPREHPRREEASATVPAALPLAQLAERMLLEQFTPACIVVDENDTIVHTRGTASRFLHIPEGAPTSQLFARVRPELRTLVEALAKAQTRDGRVHRREAHVELDGTSWHLEVSAHPLGAAPGSPAGRAFVIAESAARTAVKPSLEGGRSHAETIELMQQKVATLQAEFRASSLSFSATNEELQTLNEELASANEGLLDSQAELQALNEELGTVNGELRATVFELERVNSDLSNLFENTQVPTVFLDGNLHVRSFTQSARDLFNLIDTDRGRPLSDVTARFDHEGLKADAQHVMRTRSMKEVQIRSRSSRWYVLRTLPYWASNGTVDGVVLTFSDVTELKRAELEVARLTARLSTQLRWLRSMVDVVPLGIGFASHGERDVHVNRSAAELLGVDWQNRDAPEPLGFSWSPGEHDSAAERLLYDAMTSRQALSELELELAGTSGELRHVLLRATSLRDANGDKVGTVSGLFDITETKRDRERAQASFERQAIVAELGIRALETQDLNGLLQRCLPAIRRGAEADLADFARLEADGRSLTHFEASGVSIPVGDEEVNPESIASRLVTRHEPLVFCDPEGAPRDWPETLRRAGLRAGARIAVSGEPGLPAYGILSVYRREARPFSPEALSFLRSAARVLSSAVERRRLDQGQERASYFEALRGVERQTAHSERLASLGTFATGIAHELNNPLGNIALSAAYGKTTNNQQRRDKMLENIRQNALRCGRIVESVLRFARDEVTEKWENELNPIVRRAAELVKSYALGRHLKVHWELEEPSAWVLGNPTELEQVFVNLLKNAAQASPKRCSVTVRSRVLDGFVRVTVADDGPGIPEPESSRIFDPFFSTKHGHGSTGLGLSLTHRIVATHGGSIRLRPPEGSGATFEIDLPLIAAPGLRAQEAHD